jgi:hypothetical protein
MVTHKNPAVQEWQTMHACLHMELTPTSLQLVLSLC